jgi:hypothetical protein
MLYNEVSNALFVETAGTEVLLNSMLAMGNA